MIASFFRPKNTFMSVANKIGKGLEEETVYLNDKELEEAGYEIHEFEGTLFSMEVPLVSFSVTISYLLATIALYSSDDHRFVYEIILLNLAAIWPLILYRVHRPRKRLITKKSSRTEPTPK